MSWLLKVSFLVGRTSQPEGVYLRVNEHRSDIATRRSEKRALLAGSYIFEPVLVSVSILGKRLLGFRFKRKNIMVLIVEAGY